MCGIAGFADINRNANLIILRKMTDALSHRGPDNGGYFFEDFNCSQLGLGHRRLSILDLSDHGHQPMEFEHLTMVYNGEVYNYKEIRNELHEEGYRFNSNSDTEVILKAYHRWGGQAVHKFNGMFAIAIFDSKTKMLILFRDRAGVKPLYWYHKDGLFMFSSELKSFHKHPAFQKQLNIEGVALFLQYGFIPQPHTIFKDTYKLNAGAFLELNIDNCEIKIENYWDAYSCYSKPKLNIGEDEAMHETERLLKSACEYRMVSDVPVGVFLSGGYDSSAVTALLQIDRMEKVKTFSIGFLEEKYNEAAHAKEIANFLGTDHTEYICTQKDALNIFPLLPEICDEPLADNSIIPTVLVSRLAREKVTVSLSADGGDELFGGYNKYLHARKYQKIFRHLPARKKIVNLLKKIDHLGRKTLHYNYANKYAKLLSIMSADTACEAMRNIQEIYSKQEIYNLIYFDSSKTKTDFEFDFDFVGLSGISDLDKMLSIDFSTYQLDNILVKVDRATMSASLEGREPLLDYRLYEYVSQLPDSLKINKNTQKYLLKKITHKYIPERIINRPKMGFTIPLSDWLSDGLRCHIDHYLSRELLKNQGVFNVEYVLQVKENYLSGQRHLAQKIWAILIFQMWHERWMM